MEKSHAQYVKTYLKRTCHQVSSFILLALCEGHYTRNAKQKMGTLYGLFICEGHFFFIIAFIHKLTAALLHTL